MADTMPERYDLEYTGSAYSEHRDMVRQPDGDWVRWEDVAARLAEAEAARMVAEQEVLDLEQRVADLTPLLLRSQAAMGEVYDTHPVSCECPICEAWNAIARAHLEGTDAK